MTTNQSQLNISSRQVDQKGYIQTIQLEVSDLRKRMTAQRNLEDQIAHLQQLLTNEGNSRRYADDEYRNRLDSSLTFMATLKSEVDAQKRLLADRRRQNADLAEEQRRIQDANDTKRIENARLRSDLMGQKDLNRDLTDKKRALIDENQVMRDRNAKDYAEIDQLQATNDSRARESAELQQKIKILDYDLQKAIQRGDDCSKVLE